MREFAGLHDLVHHRAQFTKALEQCTKNVYQSRYVDSFITIIQQMPGAVVPSYGREVRRTTEPYTRARARPLLTLLAPR